MKTSKIIIGILSILIGIVALIESYDVFRLATSFGVNGFHIYVGFIVGFIFISLGIMSFAMMDKQSKKYAETAISLSGIAIFLCFRGPELFTDLLYFAGWGAICVIFAIIAYSVANKHEKNEGINQLTSQFTCPHCHAVIDESSMFCNSCGKKIKENCPHCGAIIIANSTFCGNCGKKINEAPSIEFALKKCPQCGATISEGIAFCTECGCKIPQGNVCVHCGSEIKNNDAFCQNCGAKIDETNTFVPVDPQKGNDSNNYDSFDNSNRGNLYIRWEGKWTLIDYKVHIWVNGIEQGEYSFKEGFEVVVPITSQEMVVETKLSFHKTKKTLFLNPQENYSYNLVYNTMSGSFGFILCDNDGNELESDKLHWGYLLLCFIIPIIGFIYALSIRKKKPGTFTQAIMVSLLGFIVSLLVSTVMPTAISKYNEIQERKMAREQFVKDSLEQVRQDSLNLIAQKEMEELEAKRYEEFKEKFTFNNFLNLLSNYDNVASAQKCGFSLIYRDFQDGGGEDIDCLEIVYGFDVEKGNKNEYGYEITSKSNHACYFIYNLDSSTYASLNFKDSSDAERFQELAKEHGLLVLDNSRYVPKNKISSGYHYVDSLDWGGEYDPVYAISQTERQNGWYRVSIGIDF